MYKEIQKSFLYNQEFLIQEFNKGSNTAFEFVFRTNYRALSYYAYGQVGCKMTAEDIDQSSNRVLGQLDRLFEVFLILYTL